MWTMLSWGGGESSGGLSGQGDPRTGVGRGAAVEGVQGEKSEDVRGGEGKGEWLRVTGAVGKELERGEWAGEGRMMQTAILGTERWVLRGPEVGLGQARGRGGQHWRDAART